MVSSPNELFTSRLRLVRPTWSDFDDLFRMHTDPRVAETLGTIASVEDGRQRMAAHLDHWARHGYGYWIARDRATDAFLGRGGLRHIALEGRPETEVGYGFRPEAWGRGLATELASAAVEFAFTTARLPDLVCFTLPTNLKSRRVMEKVGFRYERVGEWAGLTHVFFRLMQSSWAQPPIEILRPAAFPVRARIVLFDWDGTLSLLREGWPEIMTGLMLDALPDLAAVESIVVGLNGRPTIVQMQALVAEIARRGGTSEKPEHYLADYQDRLFAMIRGRYADIEAGRVRPEAWALPGALALLRQIRAMGLAAIVLSGTERRQVQREAELLGIAPLIDELHAPAGDDPSFHKRDVIRQLLSERGLAGKELLGFGDGVVETEEVRRSGGVAIAVASETPPRRGVHPEKRARLIEAGADAVIGDYDDWNRWWPQVMQAE